MGFFDWFGGQKQTLLMANTASTQSQPERQKQTLLRAYTPSAQSQPERQKQTLLMANTVTGSIGQTTFAGAQGSFGEYDAAKFHDASTGNAGQYSTPGGVGHAPLEETQRTFENVFHATPHGHVPASKTEHNFNPFGAQGAPSGSALAPAMRHTFRRTVRHQPSRSKLTGQV